ncbi:hypothetical protein RCO27_16045 [Sphingosinicella sp. LHD-64]|uniref:hypothetical protein n=1 Tax=Sphingosinicella sp. LHD-64 TaxID=3072139 RepID=UPI002810617B|nr:hypothetical protein [Sphingosinicella sp. LHD-64]MDQ8757741.1 hypothetical protein [Sphingosinicella sp. LHD-64]
MVAKKTNGGGTPEAKAEQKGRAARALDTARSRTQSAYEAARERTSEVTDQLGVYPVAAVLGGLAIGALIGALAPRTRRETEWLGKTGHRLVEAGREAARKGIDAGRARTDEITGKVVRAVGEAVGSRD